MSVMVLYIMDYDPEAFPDQWRHWIISCVTSSSAFILLNESSNAPFKLKRGLRQGHHLSPFLFDLVVECLSLVILQTTELNLWEGVEVSRRRRHNSIFKSCINGLMKIKNMIMLFSLASGVHINFYNSSILCINIDPNWIKSATNSQMCKVGSFLFTYLGYPIGGQISRISS